MALCEFDIGNEMINDKGMIRVKNRILLSSSCKLL